MLVVGRAYETRPNESEDGRTSPAFGILKKMLNN
jgi:hypothetical protein